jgi:hypothetical protein
MVIGSEMALVPLLRVAVKVMGLLTVGATLDAVRVSCVGFSTLMVTTLLVDAS